MQKFEVTGYDEDDFGIKQDLLKEQGAHTPSQSSTLSYMPHIHIQQTTAPHNTYIAYHTNRVGAQTRGSRKATT